MTIVCDFRKFAKNYVIIESQYGKNLLPTVQSIYLQFLAAVFAYKG